MLLQGGFAVTKALITGATGQVGSKTLDFLLSDKEIEIVAAARSPEKAAAFTAKGIATVILDSSTVEKLPYRSPNAARRDPSGKLITFVFYSPSRQSDAGPS
jgi:nucleoside-diphosphate-sugar epimerase